MKKIKIYGHNAKTSDKCEPQVVFKAPRLYITFCTISKTCKSIMMLMPHFFMRLNAKRKTMIMFSEMYIVDFFDLKKLRAIETDVCANGNMSIKMQYSRENKTIYGLYEHDDKIIDLETAKNLLKSDYESFLDDGIAILKPDVVRFFLRGESCENF